MSEKFDIILVHSFCRQHFNYLSIIKALSGRQKIALLLGLKDDPYAFYSEKAKASILKTIDTEKKFISLCEKLGAKLIYLDQPHECQVFAIHHFGGFNEMAYQKIRQNIKWTKVIDMFYPLGTMAAIEHVKPWMPSRYFAPIKFILDIRKETEPEFNQAVSDIVIEECGIPFAKYPVFSAEDFNIDYLIAFPSPIHFRKGSEVELCNFLKTLLKLTTQIRKSEKVYIKFHPVLDEHRYFRKTPSWLGDRSLALIEIISRPIDLISKVFPILSKKVGKLRAFIIYNLLLKRYPDLSTLTEYHNFGVEVFLPYVKKGLISGHSVAVLHALINKIPVYCCDPQEKSIAFKPITEPYSVASCDGQLKFDEKEFARIPDVVRQADMIELIKSEIA